MRWLAARHVAFDHLLLHILRLIAFCIRWHLKITLEERFGLLKMNFIILQILRRAPGTSFSRL